MQFLLKKISQFLLACFDFGELELILKSICKSRDVRLRHLNKGTRTERCALQCIEMRHKTIATETGFRAQVNK